MGRPYHNPLSQERGAKSVEYSDLSLLPREKRDGGIRRESGIKQLNNNKIEFFNFMSDLSYFESRQGILTCNSAEFFAFVTDIRNFKRFIPKNSITNWYAGKDICSFSVSMIGKVTVRLVNKVKFNKVVFEGDALNRNDFSLTLDFSDGSDSVANVRAMLNGRPEPSDENDGSWPNQPVSGNAN